MKSAFILFVALLFFTQGASPSNADTEGYPECVHAAESEMNRPGIQALAKDEAHQLGAWCGSPCH
jgi:hypothetical protein